MDDEKVTVRGSVKRSPNSAHCHKLVAEVAKAAAHELFDTMMMDQVLWDLWRKRFPGMASKRLEERFVGMYWGKCIPFARATLARLLSEPIDEAQKESIMDALVLDSTLVRGRAVGGPAPSLRELLN